jgi:hypothetical protein
MEMPRGIVASGGGEWIEGAPVSRKPMTESEMREFWLKHGQGATLRPDDRTSVTTTGTRRTPAPAPVKTVEREEPAPVSVVDNQPEPFPWSRVTISVDQPAPPAIEPKTPEAKVQTPGEEQPPEQSPAPDAPFVRPEDKIVDPVVVAQGGTPDNNFPWSRRTEAPAEEEEEAPEEEPIGSTPPPKSHEPPPEALYYALPWRRKRVPIDEGPIVSGEEEAAPNSIAPVVEPTISL